MFTTEPSTTNVHVKHTNSHQQVKLVPTNVISSWLSLYLEGHFGSIASPLVYVSATWTEQVLSPRLGSSFFQPHRVAWPLFQKKTKNKIRPHIVQTYTGYAMQEIISHPPSNSGLFHTRSSLILKGADSLQFAVISRVYFVAYMLLQLCDILVYLFCHRIALNSFITKCLDTTKWDFSVVRVLFLGLDLTSAVQSVITFPVVQAKTTTQITSVYKFVKLRHITPGIVHHSTGLW